MGPGPPAAGPNVDAAGRPGRRAAMGTTCPGSHGHRTPRSNGSTASRGRPTASPWPSGPRGYRTGWDRGCSASTHRGRSVMTRSWPGAGNCSTSSRRTTVPCWPRASTVPRRPCPGPARVGRCGRHGGRPLDVRRRRRRRRERRRGAGRRSGARRPDAVVRRPRDQRVPPAGRRRRGTGRPHDMEPRRRDRDRRGRRRAPRWRRSPRRPLAAGRRGDGRASARPGGYGRPPALDDHDSRRRGRPYAGGGPRWRRHARRRIRRGRRA